MPLEKPLEPSPHVPTPTSSAEAADEAHDGSPHVPSPACSGSAQDETPIPAGSEEEANACALEAVPSSPEHQLEVSDKCQRQGKPEDARSASVPSEDEAARVEAPGFNKNHPVSSSSSTTSSSRHSKSSKGSSVKKKKKPEASPIKCDEASYHPKNDAKLARAARALSSPLAKKSPPSASSWQKDWTPPKKKASQKGPSSKNGDANDGTASSFSAPAFHSTCVC